MKQWHIFPPQLDKPCTATLEEPVAELTSHSGTHPSNGAPCQTFDVPDGTPTGHGATLRIGPTTYHGVLYLDLPTGVGLVTDVFPFKNASAPTSARRGLVQLAGRMVFDADGPFNPLSTTLFWALGRAHNGERDRVKQNLQWVKGKRYDGVRILGQVAPNGLWAECPIDPRWPTYQNELADLIDLAYDCGLRVKLTLIGGGDPDPVETARKVAEVVRADRQHKILLLEPVNEHNADPEAAEKMVPILQATGCLVVPGFGDIAPGWGIEDIKALSERSGADGCAYHTSRTDGDNGARQVRQCWDFKEFGLMADDGEGPGPGASVADFPNPFKNASKAAANMICGASFRCGHTGSGVYGKTYQATTAMRYANLWEQPNADVLFDSIRHADDHIPPEVANWQKYNTGHPVEIASGSVNKLYGTRSNDGRYVQVAIGCESPITLRATRPTTVKLYSPASGEPYGTFQLAAGEVVQPTAPLWCYVMVGE